MLQWDYRPIMVLHIHKPPARSFPSCHLHKRFEDQRVELFMNPGHQMITSQQSLRGENWDWGSWVKLNVKSTKQLQPGPKRCKHCRHLRFHLYGMCIYSLSRAFSKSTMPSSTNNSTPSPPNLLICCAYLCIHPSIPGAFKQSDEALGPSWVHQG